MGNNPKYGDYEAQKLGTIINNITVNGAKCKNRIR